MLLIKPQSRNVKKIEYYVLYIRCMCNTYIGKQQETEVGARWKYFSTRRTSACACASMNKQLHRVKRYSAKRARGTAIHCRVAVKTATKATEPNQQHSQPGRQSVAK